MNIGKFLKKLFCKHEYYTKAESLTRFLGKSLFLDV